MEIRKGDIMFTEDKRTELHISDNGIIIITIITSYYRDGNKIGEDHWQQAMVPDPVYVKIAEELLDEYHLNIIRSVWTEEVIQKFKEIKSGDK